MKKIIGIVTLGLLVSPLAMSKEKSGKDIMDLVYNRDNGKTSSQTMKMTLISKTGKQRVRQVITKSKDYGSTTKAIMKFTHPSNLKKTGMLIFDNENSPNDDQWVYLPSLQKTKKISAGDQKSNFFGSDLIYADLTKRRLQDYSFKRLKNVTFKGQDLWHVEATPNANERRLTGYKKIVYLVDQKTHLAKRTVFTLVNGENKIADINQTAKVSSIVLPKKITIVSLKNGKKKHSSVFSYSNIKVNSPISDSEFTKAKLQQ